MFKIGDMVRFTDKYTVFFNSDENYKIIEVCEETEECYIINSSFPIPPSLQDILKEKVSFEMIEKY